MNVVHFRRNREGSFWLTLFGLNFSGQLARWKGGPFAHLNWGTGDGASIGFSAACFFGLWFHWDIPWRVSRRVRFLRGEKREFGWTWNGGVLHLLFGHQPMGTHYGYRKGRFSGVRRAWLNKEVALWRNTWVIGRDRHCSRVLATREMVIDCGRWPGDQYAATEKLTSRRRTNRFRTQWSRDYCWSLPSGQHGIPVDTRGKWGDRYSEVFGFGAEDTGEPSEIILRRRLDALLSGWPKGLIAEYDTDKVPV